MRKKGPNPYADGRPLAKKQGSRVNRRQGTKTRSALRTGSVYYRACLDRRKDKTRGA